jgi:hypothetical protein
MEQLEGKLRFVIHLPESMNRQRVEAQLVRKGPEIRNALHGLADLYRGGSEPGEFHFMIQESLLCERAISIEIQFTYINADVTTQDELDDLCRELQGKLDTWAHAICAAIGYRAEFDEIVVAPNRDFRDRIDEAEEAFGEECARDREHESALDNRERMRGVR